MTISRALSPAWAWTRPFGPMVRRCSWHSTVPSTSPSMVKSSRLKIWPFTVTFLPRVADPAPGMRGSGSKFLVGDDITLVSLFCVSATDAGLEDTGLSGGTSSSFLLLHMRSLDLLERLHPWYYFVARPRSRVLSSVIMRGVPKVR